MNFKTTREAERKEERDAMRKCRTSCMMMTWNAGKCFISTALTCTSRPTAPENLNKSVHLAILQKCIFANRREDPKLKFHFQIFVGGFCTVTFRARLRKSVDKERIKSKPIPILHKSAPARESMGICFSWPLEREQCHQLRNLRTRKIKKVNRRWEL